MARNNKNKKSSLSGIIGIIILVCIISKFSTLFIIIGAVILLCIFLYVVKISKSQNNYTPKDKPNRIHSPRISQEQIKRYTEILSDSLNLVNDSNNLDTVLHRYNTVIEMLEKLSTVTNEELNTLGFYLKEPISDTLRKMQDNKAQLFNQAIIRNLEHDINSVSKRETKKKKILRFRAKYENNFSLLPENKSFLNEQCNSYLSKYAQNNYTLINSIDHTVQTITQSEENTFTYHIHPDDFLDEFYKLSSMIESSKDINKKIEACEKSYPLLKEFCRYCLENDDGELPPSINCRDVGPEMYMRLGKWNDTERVIQICADANAYYPDNDGEIWAYYNDYKKIALLATSYISDNPGCLQSKLYNALNVTEDDREHLKHFLRCSLQIKKEKSGNTNKLYLS